ncbi:hypothetical protein KJ660_00750 [Candidatus Micrarchaeota archaeon]|nr:hypothetical protein [Candidatus Micrarchaeota archaeon]
MKGFNERGQEFSVFKLLISAVVAVVILTMLLQIMGIIPSLGQADPTKESVSILKDAYNNRYNDFKSKAVTFTADQKINRKAIAEGTGLIGPEDLCLFLDGAYDNSVSWDLTDNYIQYTGGGQKQAFLAAYCDRGSDLEENLGEGGYTSFIPVDYRIECGDTSNDCLSSGGTCCIVGVIAG